MHQTRHFFLLATAVARLWAAPATAKLGTYAQFPLNFEANEGQTAAPVRYLARGLGYTAYMLDGEAVVAFSGTSPVAVLHMKLARASTTHSEGLDLLKGKSNYYIGNDNRHWRTGIANFGRVRYRQVYPGIDLVYHGRQRQLEYDFEIAPGADPSRIRLALGGAGRISIDPSGDLTLGIRDQQIYFRKPEIYQVGPSGRQPISGRYVSFGRSEVGFQLGPYDPALPLVIDPVLVRSTFLGGPAADSGYGIAVDGAGFSYVTGSTASIPFPLVACFQCAYGGGVTDAFVTAFNPAGGFLYSTYFGGPGNDTGYAISVPFIAGAGPMPAFIAGSTTGGFPLIAPVQPVYGGGPTDAFVTALNPAGAPMYSTYLGGAGKDVAHGIAVDTKLNAYITGSTNSANFPRFKCHQCALGGGTDAFVTALPPPGAPFLYSTYLGGAGNDIAYGISVDDLGDAGITGSTTSPNFPVVAPCAQCVKAGGTDAFISFLTFNAGPPPQAAPPALSWSTYWGGGGNDVGYGISIDNLGTGWITGSTTNNTFPVRACVQCVFGGGATDAIVVSFQKLPGVAFSDFLGGTGNDIGYGIAELAPNLAFFTGGTTSANLPLAGCFQCVIGGGSDAFVAEYGIGARVFSSFLGGVHNDYGRAIAVNPVTAFAYITGITNSANFPVAAPCTQCVFPGGPSDAFVTVIH